MKDISGYIVSLLDEFTFPYKITSPKKGVYRIDITKISKKVGCFIQTVTQEMTIT
jgi:hypothetical protein